MVKIVPNNVKIKQVTEEIVTVISHCRDDKHCEVVGKDYCNVMSQYRRSMCSEVTEQKYRNRTAFINTA